MEVLRFVTLCVFMLIGVAVIGVSIGLWRESRGATEKFLAVMLMLIGVMIILLCLEAIVG